MKMKRVLYVILSFVLLFSLLSVTVYADEEGNGEISETTAAVQEETTTEAAVQAPPLPEIFTVKLDYGGHGENKELAVPAYEKIVNKPEAPFLEGSVFDGWYIDNGDGTRTIWDFDNRTVDGNITLYAVWTEAREEPAAGTDTEEPVEQPNESVAEEPEEPAADTLPKPSNDGTTAPSTQQPADPSTEATTKPSAQAPTEPESTTEEPAETQTALEYPEFNQSQRVNSVLVSVYAPEGIFPAGARLQVFSIPSEQVEDVIEEEREPDVNVAVSYTFDIKVLDANGAEIQPADGEKVKISFRLAEVADENLDTAVYHIEEDENTLNAVSLDVDTVGQTAIVETGGFSVYIVEFTYEKLEYVLRSKTIPSTANLSDILSTVGLSGTVAAVESNNNEKLSIEKDNDDWKVTVEQAFEAADGVTLTVNINEVDYVIAVKVDSSEKAWSLIGGILPYSGDRITVNMGGTRWDVKGDGGNKWLLISNGYIRDKESWSAATGYCVTYFDTQFSPVEKNAVIRTTKEDQPFKTFLASPLDNDALFLLSAEEARTYDGTGSLVIVDSWLRSLSQRDPYKGGIIHYDGVLDVKPLDDSYAVHPAFQLDLDAVFFTSGSVDMKDKYVSVAYGGSFGRVADPSYRGIKLMLKDTRTDSPRKNFQASVGGQTSVMAAAGETFTVSYSGAATNDYISALLCNSDGNPLDDTYYATTEQNSEQTWSLTLPNNLEKGNYILKVFSEEMAGKSSSDHASPVTEISLTVPYTVTVTKNDPAGGSVTESGSYAPGATVTFTAAPSEGYVFEGWQLDGSTEGLDHHTEITIENLSADHTLEAYFWKVDIGEISPQTFIGSQIKPEVSSVQLIGVDSSNGTPAVKGTYTDEFYEVSYGDNLNAGKGTLTVEFIKDFTGSASTQFEIDKASIEDAEVTVSSQVYTGEPLEPIPTVVWHNLELAADTDFTRSYNNNINVGTAAVVTVTGKNNFKDSSSVNAAFEITPRPVTIKVNNAVKGLGQADPVFTGTVEGLVNPNDLGEIKYYRTNADEEEGTYPGVLSAKYDENPNYTVTVVNGDFSIKTVQVTFVNEDGTELQSSKTAYGTSPKYSGAAPKKAADEEYTYTWSGWTDGTKNYKTTDTLPAVTANTTYKATYTATKKIHYKVVEGEGSEYKQGSDGTLTFVFKRSENDEETYDHFTGAKCDGQLRTRDKHYTASKGSVIIELKASFLKTLSAGEHTLTAIFDDAEDASATFTVLKAATYTVTFSANGHGTAPASQNVLEGQKATKPANLSAQGYTFGGWYTEAGCRNAFDFNTPITNDITLYAKWTAASSGGGSSGGSGRSVPGTGDTNHTVLWAALMVIAILMIGGAIIACRKRRSH